MVCNCMSTWAGMALGITRMVMANAMASMPMKQRNMPIAEMGRLRSKLRAVRLFITFPVLTNNAGNFDYISKTLFIHNIMLGVVVV